VALTVVLTAGLVAYVLYQVRQRRTERLNANAR